MGVAALLWLLVRCGIVVALGYIAYGNIRDGRRLAFRPLFYEAGLWVIMARPLVINIITDTWSPIHTLFISGPILVSYGFGLPRRIAARFDAEARAITLRNQQ